MLPLRRVSQIRQKVFCGRPPKKQATPRKIGDEERIKQTSTNRLSLSFLAADIPLHKLNHPSLKYLFATMGKVLSSETAAREYVAKLASKKKKKQMQELLRDKKLF